MVTVEISRNVPLAKDQNTFNLESVLQICLITLILLINTLVTIFLLHLLIHFISSKLLMKNILLITKFLYPFPYNITSFLTYVQSHDIHIVGCMNISSLS